MRPGRVDGAPARVLSIAGSDSGGGAGIQADLKTMLVHGVHAMSAVTAVTAQNSLGVQGVWTLPVEAVRAQVRSVVDDIGVDAVKTGMLASLDIIFAVAEELAELTAPVVVDPVCASKHGDALIEPTAVRALAEHLLPQATVVTPNLPEATLLTGLAAGAEPAELAQALLAYGPQWVLIKGGHAVGDPVDHLFGVDGSRISFGGTRSDNRHTHGTGCSLASAIASRLALGDDVPAAVGAAKAYVSGAITAGFALGAGIGPTDHLWAWRPMVEGAEVRRVEGLREHPIA